MLASHSPASGQILPTDAVWYTFDTPHFRVSFTTGLEEVARRAADRAERAHALLSREFVPAPAGRIELVVADNVDVANGTASPFPRNRVLVYAHPPAGDEHLAFHDDWLELLILHELVHVFHLEDAGGVWRSLRRVFGRDPFLFPQIFNPSWMVEGLATYFESEHTGAGRVRGSSLDMILRTAILEEAFFDIDRVTADPVTWPGALTRYVYGALFVDHLARRHGAEAVTEFVRRVGRQIIPYRLERPARQSFGMTLTTAWQMWEDSLRLSYAAVADSLRARGLTEPELLSTGGRLAHHPRYSPDGSTLVYGSATGREEPELVRVRAGESRVSLTRVSTLGRIAWFSDGNGVLFSQLEYAGRNAVYSDLYSVSPGEGPDRVTRGARIWDADVQPKGDRVVAVASAPGTNFLILLDLSSSESRPLVAPSLDAYWSAPRWSPDGRRIAVSRWQSGGRFDVLVLDTLGNVLAEITTDRAVDSHPAWSPDGRYLVFSSDRTGIPNLFAHDTDTGLLWQVTNVLTGAFQPDVSPDGEWIAFSYYRSDGYHIARIPFDTRIWKEAPQPDPDRFPPPPGSVSSANDPTAVAAEAGGAIRRYSAWPSVLPASWFPLVVGDDGLGYGVGAGLGGTDVVERHVWRLAVLGYPSDGQLEGAGSYRYRGWANPVLDLRGSQVWEVLLRPTSTETGEQATPALLRREREVEGTLSWLRPAWRSLAWVETGVSLLDRDHLWKDRGFEGSGEFRYPLDLGGVIGVGYSTVRGYELSLTPQQGFLVSGRVQARRYLDPPDGVLTRGDYSRATLRSRGYHAFGRSRFAPSVIALRLDGGVETNAAVPGFTLGGGGGRGADPPDGLQHLPTGVAFPVRGYAAGTQGGNRVVSSSAEYRFPILLVERGYRLLPVAAKRLWGDVFIDAGAAWCPGGCRIEHGRIPATPRPLVSVGAEAMLDLRLGYFADLPLRLGVAVPLREPGAYSPQAYLRVGRVF